jgi:cobalt/nickel transport system ATP-binding protein
MLEGRDIWVSYPGVGTVLRGVTLRLRKGEVVALLGPNGSGKTTLLLTLAGLIRPERGEVLLDGAPLWGQLPEARRRIGVLFQDPDDQLFNPTVREELLFALEQLGLSEEEKRRRIAEVAELLGIDHLVGRPTHALSVGEKRRVALASILVYDPEFLLLDEPTANLDPSSAAQLARIICSARAGGRGVLVATQDSDLALALADRVAVLQGGRVVWEGERLAPDLLEELKLARGRLSCGEQ